MLPLRPLTPEQRLLFDANVGLAIHLAGPDDDRCQEARLALWYAVQEYKPARGTLSAFAGVVIRNRLYRLARERQRALTRLPTVPLGGGVVSRTTAEDPPDHDDLSGLEACLTDFEREVLGEVLLDAGRPGRMSPGLLARRLVRSRGWARRDVAAALRRIRDLAGELCPCP